MTYKTLIKIEYKDIILINLFLKITNDHKITINKHLKEKKEKGKFEHILILRRNNS